MERFASTLGIHVIAKSPPKAATPAPFLDDATVAQVRQFHASVAGYRPTPLVRLDGLAKRLGVGRIYIKDESHRFGLNAFKSLGGLFAIAKVVRRQLGLDEQAIRFADLQTDAVRQRTKDMVFITATDGNHGKGIAWAAAQLGCRAVVYMPAGSAPSRVEAIRQAGQADVLVTDVSYDDAVRKAAETAAERGWHLVQDTAWEGYTDIPTWITQGYTTMSGEALDQLLADGVAKPTHVFLQAGVGSMAGAVLGHFANHFAGAPPLTTIVEPDTVACIYRSAEANDGGPHAIEGNPVTIMAGLNCGRPNPLTWPILRDFASFFAACPDAVAERGMRLLARPTGNDSPVVSGESGSVGLGLLSLLMERPELAALRARMGLDSRSTVLLFSTEGDTDPVAYEAIVNSEEPRD